MRAETAAFIMLSDFDWEKIDCSTFVWLILIYITINHSIYTFIYDRIVYYTRLMIIINNWL